MVVKVIWLVVDSVLSVDVVVDVDVVVVVVVVVVVEVETVLFAVEASVMSGVVVFGVLVDSTVASVVLSLILSVPVAVEELSIVVLSALTIAPILVSLKLSRMP